MKHLFTLIALFGLSLFAQTVPNYVPTNGLVGWWPFNGNANDLSGNGNNGTVNGATLTADRFGNANSAYSFDGMNDFIDITNTTGLSTSQGITLSIWTKNFSPNGITNHQYAFLIGNNPNARITITDNFEVSGSVLNCNCSNDLVCTYTINPSNWVHIVLTYNLSLGEQKLYIDGVLVDTKTESMTSYYTTNNNAKRFGSYGFNQNFFKGILDDAGLWNRALTTQEVQNLHNDCKDSLQFHPQDFTAYTIPGWANFKCKSTDTTAIYQWQQNSGSGWSNLSNFGAYTGVTSDSLLITGVTSSMNNYGYRCIVASCTTDTSDVAILNVVNGVILNESTLPKLVLSPNPTSGIVRFNQPIEGTYRVFTSEGRVVQIGEMGDAIDLSAYPDGIYQIEVQSSNERRTFKAVKQR